MRAPVTPSEQHTPRIKVCHGRQFILEAIGQAPNIFPFRLRRVPADPKVSGFLRKSWAAQAYSRI